MKKFIEKLLKNLAKKILQKYHPKVIGITGSVGKTGTKEMIYIVLTEHFNVRQTEKNFNTEVGVPLTIIGAKGPGRSIVAWLRVFYQALSLILFNKNYPEILILEMAADKPGDIKYLTHLAPCHVGVITTIGPTHLEQFQTTENVLNEKKIIVTHLDSTDIAVLNQDDPLITDSNLLQQLNSKIITFGFDPQADVRATDFNIPWSPPKQISDFAGVQFTLHYQNQTAHITLPGILGRQQTYNALTAATVGISLKLKLDQIAISLQKIQPLKGRMRLIDGLKNSLIIDDTYNSSPLAADFAIDILQQLTCAANKFAILGNMLELGDLSMQAHQDLGTKIAHSNINYLITVGDLGQLISQAARQSGMSENSIFDFDTSEDAGKFVQNLIKPGDLILVKGSQGVRMEKVVKEIMAQPNEAKKLLVRQDKTWQ